MKNKIQRFLAAFDDEHVAIRQVCEPLVGEDSIVDPASGAMLISRRPRIAPEAYAFVLFPGIPAEVISRYEEVHSKASHRPLTVPSVYRDVLGQLNGGSSFEMNLFGLPVSMTSEPRLLSRSVRQPLDLGTANTNWFIPYKPRESQFHIGSGPFSWEENLGYFLNEDGSVDALRKGGEKFGSWPTLRRFLVGELTRAASLYPSYEERWFEFRRQLDAKELERKLVKRSRPK